MEKEKGKTIMWQRERRQSRWEMGTQKKGSEKRERTKKDNVIRVGGHMFVISASISCLATSELCSKVGTHARPHMPAYRGIYCISPLLLLPLLPLPSPCLFYCNLTPQGVCLWVAALNAALCEVEIIAHVFATVGGYSTPVLCLV